MPYVGNRNTVFTTFTTSDANVTDDLTVTDDASVGGDLTVTGSLKNGSTNFTIDSSGDIHLDADAADIKFFDGGTEFARHYYDSNHYKIYTPTNNGDMLFQGTDGGSAITALTLDMSEAGAATFNNNVTAFSDRRLKSDIQTLENGLEKVEQLRGVTYIRNDNIDGGQQLGVIAQEVEEVFPQVVLTADDERGTKSVDYGRLTGALIEAVKELSVKVKNLEEQLNGSTK